MIPKRIFQTWKSKTELPENMAYWQSTWIKHNPNYEYELWDDSDNREFIKKYYPWFLEKYDSYDVMIKRVDAVRYFYLYHYGGIYVDLDFECIENFDDIVSMGSEYDVIFGRMGDEVLYEHEHNIPNAIMISKPRQSFWLCVFYNLFKVNHLSAVEYATGPVILKSSIEMYAEIKNKKIDLNSSAWYINLLNMMPPQLQPSNEKSKIKILDGDYFYPINWKDFEHQEKYRSPVVPYNKSKGIIYDEDTVKTLFPNSYAVTYWTHTH